VPKQPNRPYTDYPATAVPDILKQHQQTIRQAQRLAETLELGLSVPWTEPTTESGDDVLLTVHERLIEMHLSILASNTYTQEAAVSISMGYDQVQTNGCC
jgi:hypothetical protein